MAHKYFAKSSTLDILQTPALVTLLNNVTLLNKHGLVDLGPYNISYDAGRVL